MDIYIVCIRGFDTDRASSAGCAGVGAGDVAESRENFQIILGTNVYNISRTLYNKKKNILKHFCYINIINFGYFLLYCKKTYDLKKLVFLKNWKKNPGISWLRLY